MDPNTFPTKGNLILAKNSLKLAHMGYELMDKKRNILIRELMGLIDEAKDIQRQIDVTFREAYAALQIANMEIGITNVQTVSYTVPVEESIRIKTRSIMGVEIPLVEADPSGQAPTYAYYIPRGDSFCRIRPGCLAGRPGYEGTAGDLAERRICPSVGE